MKDKQLTRLALFFFSTRHAVKTWFELLRVKSYRMIRGKYEVMEGSSH